MAIRAERPSRSMPRAAPRRIDPREESRYPERGLFQPLPHGDHTARALVLVTTALVIFGTIFVASASEGQSAANGGSAFSITIHDIAYLILGVFAFYLAARCRLERLVRSAPLLMAVGLVLLVAVKAVGVEANGGKRWLNLHLINLQPSEIFKLCTVVFIGWLVLQCHDELNDWKQLAIRTLPIWLGCGLIVLEPDLGTASVILVIAVVMLAVAGLSRRLLVGSLIALGAAVGIYMISDPYSARRFFSFLHPNSNLATSGYQLFQSRIGLGAGGVSGLGLGHSREIWGLLPNPQTDFIFSVIGEELGVIGTFAVIALFIAFLFVAVRIARQCSNQVYRLIAVGIATWIIVEALLNIASVVGWWAVTGVPLPFFSYGGTALITELAAIGVLYNIAHDRSHSSDLTIPVRTRAARPAPRPAARPSARGASRPQPRPRTRRTYESPRSAPRPPGRYDPRRHPNRPERF
ncbi:MAG TPA: putative peptidoglycan glycosyltransferase FtsW [Acidimicrobiales bacterium]|nr:putative peptidoglycan glycosyltransferase FtsW [Acidimicrobiales bacterium]